MRSAAKGSGDATAPWQRWWRDNRQLARVRGWAAPPRRRDARVGVMTCALDEVACAAFTVGAVVEKVDLHVFVDTGSRDGTAELIEHLYMSIARERALEILRAHDIDYVVKLDADDVMFDDGVGWMVDQARWLPPRLTHFAFRHHELYQWELIETLEWLEALRDGRDVFHEIGMIPHVDRVFAVTGARARRKWTDEAVTGRAEGLAHDRAIARQVSNALPGAHYGWARPVRRKREKIAIWTGRPDGDPRVNRLRGGDDPKRRRQPPSRRPRGTGTTQLRPGAAGGGGPGLFGALDRVPQSARKHKRPAANGPWGVR